MIQQVSRPAYPNARQAIFILFGSFAMQVLVAVVLTFSRKGLGISKDQIAALTIVIGNALMFLILMRAKRLSYAALFQTSPLPATETFAVLLLPLLMIAPLLGVLIEAVVNAVAVVWPMSVWQEAMFAMLVKSGPMMLLTTCIFAPLFEEMLYRGIILRSFLQQYPRWIAILASAILFGAVHMNLYQFIGATLIGCLLGYLYERTRSLAPCIVLHVLNNTMACLWPDTAWWQTEGSAPWLAAVVIIGIAGAWMLFRALEEVALLTTARQRLADGQAPVAVEVDAL